MRNRASFSCLWISCQWKLALSIAGLLAVALVACSGSNPAQTATEAQPGATLAPPPTHTPAPTAGAVTVSFRDESPPEESDRPAESSQSQPATSGQATPENTASPSPQEFIAALEELLNGIYENALPSVVYIRVGNPELRAFRGNPSIPEELLWGAGSGFVWDMEGHIVTNHHVVETSGGVSDEIMVIFADSSQASATVIGSDPDSDLAVLKLKDGDWSLQPLPLGDSSEVRVGQLSVALGAPFGQEFTMTSGIVSAKGRNIRGAGQFAIPEVIQTDAAINPGNSGGPLLDRLGQVIGINTQILSNTGNFSGVGMAVPVNIAKRVIPPLIEDGEFDYPWLGVSISPVGAAYAEALELPGNTRGALVLSVVEGSPADRAGLRGSDSTVEVTGMDYPAGGDVIIAIGAHGVTGSNELIAHLTYHNSPGETVTLTVLRDGQREEIEVTLGERP